MRGKQHGYADEEETYDCRAGGCARPLPELPQELLDELVKGPMTPGEVQDLMLALNKAVIERAMGAEMNMHLGYRPGQARPPEQANEPPGTNGALPASMNASSPCTPEA